MPKTHPPGPWKAHKLWVNHNGELVGTINDKDAKHNVATVIQPGAKDRDQAQADLIMMAAGPDLFEALADAVEWIEAVMKWDDKMAQEGAGDPDLTKYQESLAKARIQ